MKYKAKNTYTYKSFIKGYNYQSLQLDLSFDGTLTSYKGFEWDGCSPKFAIKIFGKSFYIGTPDFTFTYYASRIHDLLYIHHKGINVKRIVIDYLFYLMILDYGLQEADQYALQGSFNRFAIKYLFVHAIAAIYFTAVVLFGWLWWYRIVNIFR